MSEQPKRIQRKRTKGWRMPPNTISVTRPGKYGNPYVIGSYLQPVGKQRHTLNDEILITRTNCLLFFREYAEQMIEKDPQWLDDARDKDMACFCKLNDACHADILLELANR